MVLDEVRAVTFSLRGRRERTLPSRAGDGQPVVMVFRDVLDEALTGAAAAAGARVQDEAAVSSLREPSDSTVEVVLQDGSMVRARAVVGADGSASRVSRYVGVCFEQVDLALEVEVPVSEPVAARWRGRMLLEWGPLPGSFGWVFPKGDICTAGVVAHRGQPGATREYLAEFLRRYGMDEVEPVRDTGHLTRCRVPDSPLARGRVMVAGDAAGLCDPWSREGISFALRSGTWAGRAAAEMAMARDAGDVARVAGDYHRMVRSTLGAELAASRRLMNVFVRHPGLVHAALTRCPPVWRQLDRYLVGQATIPDLVNSRLGRTALALAALLK